jgi:hypothetical protein
MEDSKIESGSTNGIIRGIEKSKNFIINPMSKSFPASSAIKSQMV